jgi:hypothetical protein
MSDTSTGTGKVVVNRVMSLDGFIAGPGDAMDWIFGFMPPVGPRRSRRPPAPCSSAGGPTTSATRWRPTSWAARTTLLRAHVRPYP